MSNVAVITPLFTPYPSCSMSDISDEEWDSLIEGTPLPDVKELLDFYAEGGSMIPFPIGTRTFCDAPNCAKLSMVDEAFCPMHNHLQKVKRESEPDPPKSLRMRAKPTCSIDDCLEPARIRGFCDKHFPVCSAEGCDNLVQAKGLCIRHYKSQYYLCTSEEGCNNHIVKDGLCHTHLKPKKKQCKQAGCTKFGHTGGFCVAHGGTTSRCSVDGCEKQSIQGGLCVAHGAVRTRCSVIDCDRQSVKGGVCVKHGAVKARCQVDGCDKEAVKGGVCVKHGAVKAKCKAKGCTSAALKDGMCQKHHPTQYKCVTCQLFIVRKIGTKCSTCAEGFRKNSFEIQVRDSLKEWFPELDFVHNKEIEASCLKYRPDFYLETKHGFALIIECDEQQHNHYDAECEVTRMFNIQQALAMPVVFLRFNCDAFKPDGINTYIIPQITKMEQLRIQIWSYLVLPPIFTPGEPYVQYVRYSHPRINELNRILAEKMSLIK